MIFMLCYIDNAFVILIVKLCYGINILLIGRRKDAGNPIANYKTSSELKFLFHLLAVRLAILIFYLF